MNDQTQDDRPNRGEQQYEPAFCPGCGVILTGSREPMDRERCQHTDEKHTLQRLHGRREFTDAPGWVVVPIPALRHSEDYHREERPGRCVNTPLELPEANDTEMTTLWLVESENYYAAPVGTAEADHAE